MSLEFQQHFRCPDAASAFRVSADLGAQSGFFRFGSEVTCYGQAAGVRVASSYLDALDDCSSGISLKDGHIQLPFDPDSVVRNLRNETYTRQMEADVTKLGSHPTIRTMYYWGRPFMPVPMRSVLQRFYLRGEMANPFPVWPVDRTVEALFEKMMALAIANAGGRPVPFIWFWPDHSTAAFILTHDVESQVGLDFIPALMDLDDRYGFRAAIQFVPEKRYDIPSGLLQFVRDRGFEINVHDLNHDGNLFRERKEFLRRAERINAYVREFGCEGFRSGALYRNPLWYDAFQFSYDMSIPNVGHLDPQGGGCCTTFPYFIGKVLEIPVTCTQDYSLFHILNQFSIDLWKQQAEKIIAGHGMISLIIHPDYVAEKPAQDTFTRMLDYVRGQYVPQGVWATLPSEINRWWRQRQAMKLVAQGDGWRIEGAGSERATIAYAAIADGRVTYSFENPGRNSLGAGQPIKSVRLSATRPTVPDVQPAPSPFPPSAGHLRRPLRIGMVGYTFYETDNRVMRYAETLAKRGDHVDVFALRQEGKPIEEEIEGVHVHRLQGRILNEKSIFSYGWRIGQFLARAAFQVTRHDLKQHYDVLHIHSVPDFLVFSALLPKLRGTPIILDIHDILPEFYASKFTAGRKSGLFNALVGVERTSCRFASHVIIANHLWRERLLSRSLAADKCTVVLNSPDRAIFTRTSSGPAENGRFIILYPGSLHWHQGIDIAVRAFARISRQVPQAGFHIYGEGPTKAALLGLIKELGVEEQVKMLPSRPLRDIARIMEDANLGIVPKRKDNFGNEAFSTKILEFMAMKIPVIVADTEIDKFYFNDSVVTFFESGNVEDLADRMLRLINNSRERLAQTENAYHFVSTVDWSAKQHEYLELVDKLVVSDRLARRQE
jgi:glycosyltransferase involved in cell wall biosynthesis